MEKLTYDKLHFAIDTIAKKIKDMKVKSLFGISRGGLIPAVYLSHATGLRIVPRPGKKTLIVDDICDSGWTLYHYKEIGCKTACIYYKKNDVSEPDIWIYEKKDDWILFPWETIESTKRVDVEKCHEHTINH